ncbi:hypothetical protein GGR54DRAFT_564415 [Hypoxylon sp. NC1633]|nr:hypothetical protein GGR54DRAFT_564415 [Hypoxylon sp. NC1633]
MLRHSVSQVFGSEHPALSPRESDDIRQPRPFNVTKRFAFQEPHQVSHGAVSNALSLNPSHQLPYSQDFAPVPMPAPMPMPTPAMQPLPLPGHMLPGALPSASYPPTTNAISQVIRRDTANLHPVFFTERLRRTPFVLDASAVTSPVAHGYTYHDAQGRADGSIPARL